MKNILIIILCLFTTQTFSQGKQQVNDYFYNPIEMSTTIKSINYKVYYVEQQYGKNVENLYEDILVERYYDNNNNLIKEIHKKQDTGFRKREFLFTYQSNSLKVGVETKFSGFTKEKKQMVIESKYDSNNNIIQSEYYDQNGSLYLKIIYKYDSNNNEIEQLGYRQEGLDYSKNTKYDSNNNKIETIQFDKDGKIDKTYLYTYDYDSNKNIIRKNDMTYKYDQNNNLIEMRSNTKKWTYKYDRNNNLIEELDYSIEESFGEKKEILTKKLSFSINYKN